MVKAIWNDKVLAESDKTIVVEGNHYFPPESINKDFFHETPTQTTCPWKGVANYYTIRVGEDENREAAWYYPRPSSAAAYLRNHVAFWRGVKIEA